MSAPHFATSLKIVSDPIFQVPETYVNGGWSMVKGDLADFLLDTSNVISGAYKVYVNLTQLPNYLARHLKQTLFTRYFTRRVRTHYDIDAFIYELILGPSLAYTCAFFDDGATTLEEAQDCKHQTILRRMELPEKGANILNIGSGWGSFEKFLSENKTDHCVTSLTISKNQREYAEKSSNQPNFKFQLEDYVNHQPDQPYDGILSIGMAEHIGLSELTTYMRALDRLLKKGGTAVVHCMTKRKSGVPTSPWIDKRIFPGGYIPSKGEMVKALEPTNLHIHKMHTHAPENYAKTLRMWRNNLYDNQDAIKSKISSHGLSSAEVEKEYRIWEMYLACSELAFLSEDTRMNVTHFVLKHL